MTEPDVPTLPELATPLVVHKVLMDRIAASRKALTAAVLGTSDAGDRKTAKLPDGQVIGAVSIAHGKQTPQVVDSAALKDWVQQHHPTEVITESHVRSSFLAVVLKAVKDEGGWLNKATGEVQPVPGVQVKLGDDYTVVTPVDDADALIEQSWRNGDIDIRATLQIGPA